MSTINMQTLSAAALLLALNASAYADDLAGEWKNANPQGGLTRVVVTNDAKADTWKIQAWGECLPTDCDWGTIDLQVLGDAVTRKPIKYGFAHWAPSFADKFMTLRIEKGMLLVEVFTIFKDGRANFLSTAKMERLKAKAP